jgi:hypothetical protein
MVELPASYTWGGERFSIGSLLTAIVRPEVTSINPENVQAGNLLTVYGSSLCLSSVCSGASAINVSVGGFACTGISIVTEGIINCKVPNIARTTPGYPTFLVQVCSALESCSKDVVTVTYPTSFQAYADGTLPTTYVPSDAAAPMPIAPLVSFRIMNEVGTPAANATCAMSSVSAGVAVSAPSGSLLTALSNASGVVTFPSVIVTASFEVAFAVLSVACTLASSVTIAPFQWEMQPAELRVTLCDNPPQVVQSQTAFNEWSVGLSHPDVPGSPCDVQNDGATLVQIPSIVCSAQVQLLPGKENAVVQHATASVNTATLRSTFSQMVLLGTQGSNYSLVVSCYIGAILVPSPIAFSVTLRGCDMGTEPAGFFCSKCPASTFSLGGEAAKCITCPPAGAVCSAGVISLLDGYYRPPSQRNAPLGPTTELHPCFNVEACTLNRTTLSYSCATGYTGPLCGVCDSMFGRFGTACRPCWSTEMNILFTAGAVIGVIAVLTFVALRKTSTDTAKSSIALRILLSFIQAVGSLRAFRAGGTQVYHDVMGWTESVSASPFSAAAFKCLSGWTYPTQYILMILSPALVVCTLILIFVLATFFRSLKLCSFDTGMFISTLRKWIQSQRHINALIFVLSMAYMPIISASLRTLDCYESAIAGEYYLRADLALNCSDSYYQLARTLALVVLAVFGCGFPLLVIVLLRRARLDKLHDPTFRSAFGFLYNGYSIKPLDSMKRQAKRMSWTKRPPMSAMTKASSRSNAPTRHFVWWEGMVLLRKAGIACIAGLITDAQTQLIAAMLLLGFFARIQQALRPYDIQRFNQLELLSLMSSTFTAILSALLVESSASSSSVVMSPRAWAITALLLLMNLGTLVVLGTTWLSLQLHSGKVAQIRQILSQQSSKRLRSLMEPGSSAKMLSDASPGDAGFNRNASHGDPSTTKTFSTPLLPAATAKPEFAHV